MSIWIHVPKYSAFTTNGFPRGGEGIVLISRATLWDSSLVQRPIFEVVRTTSGAVSIRNNVVNEIMHNPVGPWAEANSLYVEQSNLKQKLQSLDHGDLVIFDVGLGAAANALAAIHCYSGVSNSRPLRIVSFERDLDLLHFALKNSQQFEHFHGYETNIAELLEKGTTQVGNLAWDLRHGDFVSLIEQEPNLAQIIFYDPYSPNVNQDMWTLELFNKIRKKCTLSEEGSLLLTYSKATPIRSALLCAGFYVGAGLGTGEKDETTQAATHIELLAAPFAQRWFERWNKSSVPYPLQTPEHAKTDIENLIRSHKQFEKLARV